MVSTMNFNSHAPNGSNMNMAPQDQPQRNVPVLTPQLLASLNPQQLQQFKSHPQFQEIMRNYIQRQQAMQAMQQGQGQGQGPQQPGMVPNQARMSMSDQSHQQRPIPHGGMAPQAAMGPRAVQGMPQQGVPAPGMAPQQGFAPVVGGHPMLPQQVQQHQGVPPPQLGGQPGAPPHMMNQQGSSIQPPKPSSMVPQPVIGPHGTPLGSQSISAVAAAAAARNPNLPSQFTPEVLSSVPMSTLSSLHEWSEKLKAEGKKVPDDVLAYEALIEKDSQFLGGYSKQLKNNKSLMERLGKDIGAYNHIKQLRMNAINVSNKGQFNNSIWGEGYQGYGNGITNTTTKLILPERDLTDDQINKKVMKNIDKPLNLVPIRLGFDLERDRFKLRDTFLWDLNEEVLTVEAFAKQLVDDYKLIAPGFYDTVAAAIREQINDYQKNPTKTLGELRIPIKVDVTINNVQLTDQFEWDILNFRENDPEDFASIMCDEMNLPGEFTTAIAHTIREQTQFFHKTLYMVGYNFDGSPVQEEEIRTHLLPALRLVTADYSLSDDFFSVLRNPTNVPDYSPSLIKLSQLEIERLDKEIERESRRKRRHNASELELPASGGRGTTSRRTAFHAGRGGPSLPDLSDLPKTFRTPAPSSVLPGAVDLGVPDIFEYTEIYANKTQVRNPDYKPQPQPIKDQVRYHHDPILGSLFVSIKMRR